MTKARFTNRFSLYYLVAILNAKERQGGLASWLVTGTQIGLRLAIYSGMYRIALGANNPSYIKGIWAIAFAQIIFNGYRPQLSLLIGREIKDGTVAIQLLRPINYLMQSIFAYIGKSLSNYSAVALFSFIGAFILTREIPISLVNLPFVLLILLLGIFLTVLIEAMLGLTGFWTVDTEGAQLMNHKLNLLFGGVIIPFALLPNALANIVKYTPWTAAAARPGYLATHFSFSAFAQLAAVLIMWTLFFGLISYALLAKGIRKLSVGGG